MAMEFRLLGAVEARINDQVIDLGPLRQQCVLVALLIDVNQVVSADQLIDHVWGNEYAHRATLYSYVSRLRKALATAENAEITRRSGGYVLTADPMTVDLYQFRHLVRLSGETADVELAAARCEQGLSRWRGQAFAGLDTPRLNQVRTSLEVERHVAKLHRNDLMLRLGRYADVLAELTTSVAENPLDERLAGQLMLALYRTGRRAEALRAHQRIRVDLAEELGVDPGLELCDLHRRMLTNDFGAVSDRDSAARQTTPSVKATRVQLLQGFARPGWESPSTG